MKHLMLHFTKIMSLYESVDNNDSEAIARLKGKYSAFARAELPKMLADLKLVRRITGQKLLQEGHDVDSYAQYWLLKLHKCFRFLFITFYYYIFPFLIVIFSTLVLYSKEFGRKHEEAATQTGPPPPPPLNQLNQG